MKELSTSEIIVLQAISFNQETNLSWLMTRKTAPKPGPWYLKKLKVSREESEVQIIGYKSLCIKVHSKVQKAYGFAQGYKDNKNLEYYDFIRFGKIHLN